jgi:propionyl-CoA carboxylase alpha chain
VITKLLVANRGEIASRVMRTCRDLDIATVAVFSDADADLPYVREADESVRLPGVTPAETYLGADAVLEAARATGADAVHPGYGFLSENAGFARQCAAAGITFVGPSPEAIEAMGSKTAAKELMAAAGVPTLPVSDPADVDGLDFPLLVKAAHGGGGRGMRIVRSAAELPAALESAQREAAAAFGDGTVFLERYVESPRHVEVQIFGDTHGTVVHLFERECSIQRRFQKIVEEAPSPAVDAELREALGAAAVTAGKAIDYVGAGTVEFVLEPDGRFWFLEVNTRLQVEHPVTEAVTGLDLVRLQLLVADRAPLPEEALTATLRGHAIEARLYAEDAPAGYLPVTGTLHRFRIDGDVRVDSGVTDGSVVSPYYDPMLAKVIAYGPTRDDARRRLARALAGAELHGVTTNRDLLVGLLREPDFRAGRTDTGYLDRHPPRELAPADPGRDRRHALAAALAGQAERRANTPVLGTLPSGWRNAPSRDQRTVYQCGDDQLMVTYRFTPDGLRAAVDGEPVANPVLHEATPDRVDLEADGVRRAYEVHRVGPVVYVDSAAGSTVLVGAPRHPEPTTEVQAGSLQAPMPGLVARLLVEVGDVVAAGVPLVVLEAMKMEHTVAAPADGTVTALPVAAGTQVETGAVLAVVEGDT